MPQPTPTARLFRWPDYDPRLTIGVLVCQHTTLYTLEPPWLDNKQDVSCIPEGSYTVIPWCSPSKGECFKLLDVPDRTDILIHRGNFLHDTTGCIIVGKSYEKMHIFSEPVKLPMLYDSKIALLKLIATYPSGFELIIRNF